MAHRKPHHSRSSTGMIRRNALRRNRWENTQDLCDRRFEQFPTSNDPLDIRRHQIDYYASLACTSELNRQTECIDKLTDGSSRPSLCNWFQCFPDSSSLLLRPLRELLAHQVDAILDSPQFSASLDTWLNLSRSDQGDDTVFQSLLKENVLRASSHLRDEWSSLLKCSAEHAPDSPLNAGLIKALLQSLQTPGEHEDTLICDEIQRGCNVGIRSPILASGLWPPDRGPKHSGYMLDLSVARSWQNYQSCEHLSHQVQHALNAEVVLQHMNSLTDPPENCVLTKLACVLKPSGKIRLIDDLRRSGVNERLHCQETIALPGLASAALLVQHMTSLVHGTDDTLVWIETDISAAFRHLPVAIEDRRFLVNLVNGTYYQHIRLPFGLRSSPLLWCRLIGAVHRIMKKLICQDPLDGTGIIYVDDLGWVTTRQRAKRVFLKILLIYSSLGLSLAYDKLRVSVNPHSLGYQWNLCQSEVQIPEEKRQSLLSQLSQVSHSSGPVPCSLVETLTGRLTWLTQILPRLRPHLAPFYALQASIRKHNLRWCRTSVGAKQCAVLFSEVLSKPCLTHTTASQLLGWELPVGKGGIVVVTDASLLGLGGIIFKLSDTIKDIFWFAVRYSDMPNLFRRLPFSSADICPLELLAACIGISEALEFHPTSVTLLCDNTPTVYSVNNNKANSRRLRNILFHFASDWPLGGYLLRAYHVSGEKNSFADFLSRTPPEELRATLTAIGTEVDVKQIILDAQNNLY